MLTILSCYGAANLTIVYRSSLYLLYLLYLPQLPVLTILTVLAMLHSPVRVRLPSLQTEAERKAAEEEALARLKEAQARNDEQAVEEELARGQLPAEMAKSAEERVPPKRTQAGLRMSCGTSPIHGSTLLPPATKKTAPTAERQSAAAAASRSPNEAGCCFRLRAFVLALL